MRDVITKTIFGIGAVGVIVAAVLLRGGNPEIDGLPTPPPITMNDTGYYHAYLCAELPATPPRQSCRHVTTRDVARAGKWRASGSFVGSEWADVRSHPASMTPVIWGNPAPGRSLR